MAKEIVSEVVDHIDHLPRFVDETSREGRWNLNRRRIAWVLVLSSLLWWLWPCGLLRTRPRLSSEFPAVAPVDDVPDIGFPESELRTWAQYAPYIPVAEYIPPPPGCAISQVNVLQRHGARYPTTDSGADMKAAVQKLQRAKHYKEDYLSFLKHFTWDLRVNDLLPLGAKQSFEAGVVSFDRYAHIVTEDNPPFIRAASLPRVVDSAANWSAGFTKASHHKIKTKVDLILPESGNITLDDTMCPNSGDGDEESKKWLKIFAPPIKKRLNSAAHGAKLTDKDTHHLIAEEFRGYAYYADVNKFYRTGYGGNLGRVQGVGYVNELLARLTGQPVRDNTQTNRTLDASPETFPLDRTLYADFSHDNEMVAIYSALGLFRQHLLPGQKLDPVKPSPLSTWILSNMVPFSARMVVERLQCTGPLPLGTFVRILVNDALQPLEFCGGVAGLCELHAFVASQRYARHDGDGDFEKCYN